MSKQANKEKIDKAVLQGDNLCLIQFKAKWDGASQLVSMMYDDLEKSYFGQIKFFRVNIDEEFQVCKEYGVTEIPTILFIRNGKVIDYTTGLISRNVLISKIQTAMIVSKY